ncbi:hypothetical protein [Rhizobium leguminosarum]|uniref:hypothetical protein n=1 Tax=Rhizobium leguminosarum TaxID=384 RepID=UPI000FEC3BE7|nr:hypothetical protein [Rhizobium leguminosarum]RWX37850.1 hypothetical protein EHI43_06830 [Rhizobium leguminosarum]
MTVLHQQHLKKQLTQIDYARPDTNIIRTSAMGLSLRIESCVVTPLMLRGRIYPASAASVVGVGNKDGSGGGI